MVVQLLKRSYLNYAVAYFNIQLDHSLELDRTLLRVTLGRLTSNHQLGRGRGAVHHGLSRARVHARLAELSVDDQQVANVLFLQDERER